MPSWALGDEADDINLARDHQGHFLVYDETMERVQTNENAENRAITIAEYREWPDRLDWEQGPDALCYPGCTTTPPTTRTRTKKTWNRATSPSTDPDVPPATCDRIGVVEVGGAGAPWTTWLGRRLTDGCLPDGPIRVAAADDEPPVRTGLAALLRVEDDLAVVGEAGWATRSCNRRPGRQASATRHHTTPAASPAPETPLRYPCRGRQRPHPPR